MFFVSSIQGTQTQYVPKVITPRTVEGIEHVVQASPIITGAVTEQHSNEGKNKSARKNPYARIDEPAPQREKAITASQIMTTPVITLSHSDTVSAAWKLFRDRHFRHLPIVSDQNMLVGILSDRDFISLGLNHVGEELSRSQQLASPIKDIMKSNVLTARPETEIRLIAEVMFTEGISAMPIVNGELELIGILTTSDILRTLVNKAPLELWV